jgi:phage-related protein
MADQTPRRIPALFYRTQAGGEVVLDWLRSLDEDDRQAIGLDLMRVQYRWPIGMPLCRALGNGLWEMRTTLARGRIARTLFCVREATIIVLSGFIKKSQKAPNEELALARKE